MKTVGVIPSRYASTRFPGKPLAMISGKPLLQWVFEESQKSQKLDEVIVATDDERIAQLCQNIKAPYTMTDPNLPSGSDRVWAAICKRDVQVVLNIQGDEPLIQAHCLDLLVDALASSQTLEMATLGGQITEKEWESWNTVKVICNHKGEAIYFSRFPIPHSKALSKMTFRQSQEESFKKGPPKSSNKPVSLKHMGIYAYRKEFLQQFFLQSPVEIEKAEGLEQLRALYLGARIQVIPVDYKSESVDIPEDVRRLESML